MSLFPQSTLLLAVDMQRAFDEPRWPRRWNRDADRNGLRLLDAWRRTARPIFHVRHDSSEPTSTLRPGQPGNRFREGFEPRDGEGTVGKIVNSAFIGTDLDIRLRRLGIEELVVFGISTDMCVSTTIRTGANMGWKITLAADACDCFDLPDGQGGTIPAEQLHAAHVATLGFEFCTVAGTDGIIARL
ncbi:cysteine hydrolase family protein [Azospirillum sp. TSO35-2]|uniref:cysteine hydrolase family protein n=1 Tax=Azospirillum sp. TSO35-2 TaxID=716796 RepID=UPI000D60C397|nr:cysteine hydrolase family protein [Azospirillum sp. TSO35-2]PWC32958.1 isochorismatase [Azospirillum sp. TSO35-2]